VRYRLWVGCGVWNSGILDLSESETSCRGVEIELIVSLKFHVLDLDFSL
jgi:hypothetical protein